MKIKKRKKKSNGRFKLSKRGEIKEEARGISHDSLSKSRQIRHDFLQKYKFIPSSILVHNTGDKAIDLSRGYAHVRKQTKKLIAETAPMLASSGMVVQGYTTPRDGGLGNQEYGNAVLSRFTQNIGRFMVQFYCPEGGIVYDPFAGHNSRMQLVFETGRSYIGYDVSKEFMDHNKVIMKTLLKKANKGFFKGQANHNNRFIELHLKSSSSVNIPDNYADFTITSPPYWDIEYYGPEEEQLGKVTSYKKFLKALKKHIEENYRVLKQGSFCCWFMNDFRKKNKFYPYHIDIYNLFCKVGFTPFNIYILKLPSVTKNFLQWTIRTKILPKEHEYVLVFVKGEIKNEDKKKK
jgi:DNA modification methylase